MGDDLKSFKKDWQRWSRVERLSAIVLLFGATATILGGSLTFGML
ncbi:MAG TPA: hypothetical protein VD978_32805 [Azospirillum sp.]|nr:hypothetical protein [Azospirillum sp.]